MHVVLAPLQLLPATIAGVLYALRVHALRGTPRAVPGVRQASFYFGLFLIVATLTMTGDISDQLFAAHMAEHLLIADVGSLALVLGLTGPVLAPVLRIRFFDRLRVLAHPAVAFPLWAIDLYLWHVPALQEAAIRHAGVHALQHMCFIVFGANMWMALLGPLPKPAWFGNLAKLGYIIAARFIGAVLGNVFLWASSPFYSSYPHLSDQVAGGAVMMVWESLLTIGLFGWLFLRTARDAEERQALMELAQARGVEIDERRIARAVAAGRGGELRLRLEAGRAPVRPADGLLELGGQREQLGL